MRIRQRLLGVAVAAITIGCWNVPTWAESYEPNDTYVQAQALTGGTYQVSGSGVDNWFSFQSNPGLLELSMTPLGSNDSNMTIYNSSLDVVGGNYLSGGATESLSIETSINDTFYIQITPTLPTATAVDFSLSITIPPAFVVPTWAESYEPNDTYVQAQALTGGTYQVSGSGVDNWFSFQSNPGLLELSMTPLGSNDSNMTLYNSSMQVIATNWLPEGAAESISIETSISDTFYIEITPTLEKATDVIFSLSVTIPTGTWTKKLDFGPIRDVSVTTYDIDKDGEDEIFVATSKGLDGSYNEVRAAALICLEANGDIKWSRSFPAIAGPDDFTGLFYATTSVTTTPVFADINGDNNIDIVVGVGGDSFGEVDPTVTGQPGDKGGVYALNGDGQILWFHESRDMIGGTSNTGDGRPDGVYGAPVVFDIDQDGKQEVIYGGWDQSLWILDGAKGIAEVEVHLADTIWSTPKIADVNNDGVSEILVSADITANADAGTSTGGIFHIISADGTQNIAGFNQPVGNANYTMLRGKWEEQALWSSPVTADLDNDGFLEIVYGTGNYFSDSRGSYIRVWEHDGALKYTLPTIGKTFATPLVTDLDGDGDLEIVAATLDGYLYGWDHNGTQLFATLTKTFPAVTGGAIFCKPVAVDINNDGKKEIFLSQGSQLVIVDSYGTQISESDSLEYIFEMFKGSPVIKDIDGDGKTDMLSGGNTKTMNQGVVYRWKAPDNSVNLTQTQVSQLYVSIFGRASEGEGNNYWSSEQNNMTIAADTMLATGAAQIYFGNSLYDDLAFIAFIYENTLGKTYAQDPTGVNYWVNELATGKSKGQVVSTLINAVMDPMYTGNPAQDRFINMVTVCNYVANTIPSAPNLNDLSAFVNFISGVNDNSSTVTAAKAAVDAF